jgi:uncharacterized membrane protein YphA (DoxX/SURF4 family)
MKIILALTDANSALGRLLDYFRSLLLLGTRLYVVWPHWTEAMHAAAAPSAGAAAAGCAGLFFALLLSLGLFARFGALGGLTLYGALRALAPSGLPGLTEAHDQLLLAFMLLVLTLFGPGRLAVDAWLERRSAARCRPATAALAS